MNKTKIGLLIVIIVLLGSFFILGNRDKTSKNLGEGPWESFMARLGNILGVQSDFYPHILRVVPDPIDQDNCNGGPRRDLCRFVATVSNHYTRYTVGEDINFSYLIVNTEKFENRWSPIWGEDRIIINPTFLNDEQIQFELGKDLIFNKFKLRIVNYTNGSVFISEEYIVDSSGIPRAPEIRSVKERGDSGQLEAIGSNFNENQGGNNDRPVMFLYATTDEGGISSSGNSDVIEIPFDFVDTNTVTFDERILLELNSRDLALLGVNVHLDNGQYAISDEHGFELDPEGGEGGEGDGDGDSECSDGLDNDNDGAVDLADFSCSSSQDDDETLPRPQCNDNIDNDGDGQTDYPADTYCTSNQGNSEGAPPPVENNIFIKNEHPTLSLTNDYAFVPISFELGEEVTEADLPSYKLFLQGNDQPIPTQIVPTSYYKDDNGQGSLYVRTAIAKVLVSLNPTQKKNYYIDSDNQGQDTFLWNTDVLNTLKTGAVKITSKDLFGGTYESSLDIDDTDSVELIESGPVMKVYKWEENLKPVSNCNSITSHPSGQCLPYLFSTTNYVYVVSGKPHIGIQNMITNFANLKEDSWNSGNPYTYDTGQNGFVFYDSINLKTSTALNSYLRILDESYLEPSYKQNIDSRNNVWWVMPANGQAQLSNFPYYEGFNTNNYIGAGQGLYTTMTLSLGITNDISYDYFNNEKVYSGQTLEKWNRIDGYFFKDIVNPDAIDPSFNWVSDANTFFGTWKNQVSNSVYGHRFGNYIYDFRNTGAPGWYEQMRQEPNEVVKYLMSCQDQSGCRRDYLDAIRFYLYGTSSIVDHGIGFIPPEHPESMTMTPIESRPYEKVSGNDLVCQILFSASDGLGFCGNDRNTDANYRKDSNGNSVGYYLNLDSEFPWHKWTGRSPDHYSIGRESYKWMLTGDYMSLTLGQNQLDNAIAGFSYLLDNTNPLWGESARGRGRVLIATSKMFSMTGDSYYKNGVNKMLQIIDGLKNQDSPGERGTNPVTGEYLPTGQFTQDDFCGSDIPGDDGTHCKVQPLEEGQINLGLAVAYFDVVKGISETEEELIKEMLTEQLGFIYTSMFKDYRDVKNKVPKLNNPNQYIWEGEGGHGLFNVVLKGVSSGNNNEIFLHTTFDNHDDDQIYQGWCGSLQVAEDLGISGYNSYKSKFAELFKIAYVTPDFVLNEEDGSRPFGIQLKYIEDEKLCGLHYALASVPNAIELNTCVDNDGDGFSTCVGDSNDNNPNIHPQNERDINKCADGIDNNGNELIDCNEWSCAWQGANSDGSNDGIPRSECKIQNLPNGFCGDGIKQTPNSYGLVEQCDTRLEESFGGVNNCASKICLPPGVPGIQGCTCG